MVTPSYPIAPRGFTLIELAIVLIIIGLITAGITSSQSLLHSATVQAIIHDIQKFRTAHNTFLLQYDEVPGDFDEAQSYWPSCTDSTNPNGAHPCNGSGSGRLGDTLTWYEPYRYWQHLSLAELLPEYYTGLYENGYAFSGDGFAPGINIPRNHRATYIALWSGDNSAGSYFQRESHSLNILDAEIWYGNPNGLLFAKEAAQIDKKLDDGKADSGNIVVYPVELGTPGCIDTTAPYLSGEYILSDRTNPCQMDARLD